MDLIIPSVIYFKVQMSFVAYVIQRATAYNFMEIRGRALSYFFQNQTNLFLKFPMERKEIDFSIFLFVLSVCQKDSFVDQDLLTVERKPHSFFSITIYFVTNGHLEYLVNSNLRTEYNFQKSMSF